MSCITPISFENIGIACVFHNPEDGTIIRIYKNHDDDSLTIRIITHIGGVSFSEIICISNDLQVTRKNECNVSSTSSFVSSYVTIGIVSYCGNKISIGIRTRHEINGKNVFVSHVYNVIKTESNLSITQTNALA